MHEKTDIFTKLLGKHNVTIYEDNYYYYIIPSDTKKDKYDNSFYLYDKKRKTMKWVPSVISYFPQIDNAKLVKSVQRREVRHMNKLNYSGDPHSVLMHYNNYLMHFNPNHDPNTGKFATKSGHVNSIKKSKKQRDALITAAIVGGAIAAPVVARGAIQITNKLKAYGDSSALGIELTPRLKKIRSDKMNKLIRDTTIKTGKRFLIGALIGYGTVLIPTKKKDG